MRILLACLAVCVLSLGSCTHQCSTDARAGIIVRVFDQATSAPITTADVEAVEGTYIEKLVSNGDGTYEGARERVGTYDVTVNQSGYTPATVHPVEVKADSCHVITRTIDVMLAPI